MIRAWLRTGFGFATVATFVASAVTLWQSPFTTPYRAQTQTELSVAVDRALHRDATPAIFETRIDSALNRGEADEATAILRLANARNVQVAPALKTRIETAEAKAEGWSACLACAISAENCPDLTRIAACNLPIELTPIGDAKAITRALTDHIAGREIDKIDLSLGVVGLASTAAILVSGGSSVTVKAGATALRVARKTGAISTQLMTEITTLATGALRLDRASDVLSGAARPAALIDGARATKLTDTAANMGRLTREMPVGDAFAVLRYADTTDELSDLARVAETLGSETRGTLAILGKSRVLRLTHRLAELALFALALLAALAGQVLALLFWLIRRQLRDPVAHTDTPRKAAP